MIYTRGAGESILRRWPGAKTKAQPSDGFYSFISYSSRDDEFAGIEPFVEEYVRVLKSRISYIPVFLDRIQLTKNHPNLRQSLAEAIESSDFVTTFVSPRYMDSEWCQLELELSYKFSRPILAIVWKHYSYASDRDSSWLSRHCSERIDIARSLYLGKRDEAIFTAVDGTLRFLDRRYGNSN